MSNSDTSFFGRPRRGGKSYWDWMGLILALSIPVVLGVATIVLNSRQAQSALDQQRAQILQTYIGNMQDLLLKGLRTSKPGDEVRLVAADQAVATLRRLDAQRNGIVLQFLRSHLGGIDLSGTDLSSADLSGADLSDVTMYGADLRGVTLRTATLAGASLEDAILTSADLTGAHLSNATFSDADLTDAHMEGATLTAARLNGAHLSGADLSGAILSGADLSGADLNHADLSGANLNGADLNGAKLNHADLSGADLSGVIDPPVSAQSKLDEAHSCIPLSDVVHYDPLLAYSSPTGLICPPPIRLTYWYTESTAEAPIITKLISQFEQQNPGIEINAMPKPFFQTRTGFISAVQKGGAPDVFRSDVGWVTLLASKGYLLNIDSYIRDPRIHPIDLSDYESLKAPLGSRLPDGSGLSPLAYDEYKGHLYGLPQVTDVLGLLYNKAELQRAGITCPPTTKDITCPPDTMDKLKADALKVVQREPRTYGFETSGTAYYALPFLYAFGGGMFDRNNNVEVGSQDSVKGLQFLVSLENTEHVMPPNVDFSDGISNMTTDFMNGKTAMIFDGPWDVSNILENGKVFKSKHSNLGIASIPQGPGGQGSPLGGDSYVISASTAHPAEAYKFISFMSEKTSQVRIAEMNDTLPTLSSAFHDNGFSSNYFISQFRNIWKKEAVARPAISQGGYLFDEFDPSIWAALDGVQSPTDALRAVADTWNQLQAGKQVP